MAGFKELQALQAELTAETACSLARSLPGEVQSLLEDGYSRLGKQLAERLKAKFHPRPTSSDLVAVWRAACNLVGIRYRITRESGRVIFSHPYCPLWEEFRRRGEFHCSETCLAMVKSLSESILPGASFQVLRSPSKEGPCIKALLIEDKTK